MDSTKGHLNRIISLKLHIMGPKKEIKKEVAQQPPKQEIPEIPLHQLQGYARFSYPQGSEYTGEWKLFNGIKLKHGKGTLFVQKVASSLVGKQMYEGQWSQDCMSGNGTYYYPDGGVYRGQWKHNKHCGQGVYEFPNGTVFEGQWDGHFMDGTGCFIDHTGKKWSGEFKKGRFQSQNQAELIKEKAVSLKKIEIKKEIDATFQNLIQAVAKSDKKTLKDNLSPFFATPENLKEYIKEPYAKFDERPPEKWTEVVNTVKTGAFKVLGKAEDATLITPDRILREQLEGPGQVVEIQGSREDKVVRVCLGGLEGKRWVIVCVIEQDKKK